MAPSYKFNYFNLRGRGEVTRWVLSYAGQEFEDNRIEFPQWPALKATTPFGQLPYLEVDGKPISQSIAIARFVARKHGLAGQNDWESAQADVLVDYVSDGAKGYFTWLSAVFSQDAKADSLKEEYLGTGVVPFLQGLERLLQSNDNGKAFFVGSKPTWGDFAVGVFGDELLRLNPTILDKYPLLKAHSNRVHELKGIKEWIAKRPETPF